MTRAGAFLAFLFLAAGIPAMAETDAETRQVAELERKKVLDERDYYRARIQEWTKRKESAPPVGDPVELDKLIAADQKKLKAIEKRLKRLPPPKETE